MSLGLSNVAGLYYQNYVNQQSKVRDKNSNVNFDATLAAKQSENTGASNIDTYTEYLKSKYGNVTIQSVGRDQASLDRVGKSMSGSDVIIAPNILAEMASNPEKAAYYEGKIDDFFNAEPQLEASFAAKGLVYEPGGVVVHEDGTVTYIGGCSDSPERVAEVNAINKAKREKEAEQRKASLERSQEAADMRRQLMENYKQKQLMAENLKNQIFFTNQTAGMEVSSQFFSAAVTAYDKNMLSMSESGI